jgi:hypothetical protein
MGEMKNYYKTCIEKLEGKRPIRGAQGGWEGVIRIYLKEIIC